MRNWILPVISLFIISLASCEKEGPRIEYPTSGAYGENVLSLSDSSILDASHTFTLSANLMNDAAVCIELVNLSNFSQSAFTIWSYNDARNMAWTISDYSFQYHTQLFESNKNGDLDLEIFFPTSSIVQVNFYENGGTLTGSKTLFWQ
jgi:hypothetical protein